MGRVFGYWFVVTPNRIFPLGEFFKNSDNLPLQLWCMENYSKLNSKLTFARVYLFRIPSARRADWAAASVGWEFSEFQKRCIYVQRDLQKWPTESPTSESMWWELWVVNLVCQKRRIYMQRDLQKRPTSIESRTSECMWWKFSVSKETYLHAKRPTKETYLVLSHERQNVCDGNLVCQKRRIYMQRDLQKRPT